MSHFVENLAVFARLLRTAGLPVGTDRLLTLIEALGHVDLESRDDVRAACQAVLIQRAEDIQTFRKLFDQFHASEAADSANEGEAVDEPIRLRTWSDREALANKDFAELTAEERAMVGTALAGLAWNLEPRRTRRWVAGRGSRVDLRRAIAQSLRTGGDIASLPARTRRTRPRPIVLLCDVSGSMELYTRTLLLFAHALSTRRRDVEAFLFSTRLTRVTREVGAAKPEAAMRAVAAAVRDWSGGTRIGDALRTFHQRWRRRVLHSRSIVILISDGWDRGDPDVLRDAVARMQRSCHRLIWLNPLIGTIDYAPLTRGLQASLPFVDDFLPVRTLVDVRELALHLGALDRHGHYRNLHVRRRTGARLGDDARPGSNRLLHSRL